MVGFNNYSRSSQKVWDPTKTLGIINQDPGYQKITCVGYAPTQGRRCRKKINKSNRKIISETLEEISCLQPNDPLVITRLKRIAGLALCVRLHQDQASDILSQWRDELPRDQRIHSGTKKRTSGAHMQSQNMKDLQEQLRKLTELMEEVQNKLHEQQPETSSEEDSDELTSAEDDSSEDDSSDCMSDDDLEEFFSSGSRRRREDNARREKERLRRERLAKEQKDREGRERRAALEKERQWRAQEEIRRAGEKRERKAREQKEREAKAAKAADQAAETERERRRQAAQDRADKAAQERLEREQERRYKESQEKERQEKEEAKRKQDAENAASNERIRQIARERAEKTAREEREKEEREQAEWNESWVRYQRKWTTFKVSTVRDIDLRDAIPWPVRSGLLRDVGCSNVTEFLEKSLPKGPERVKLLRKECQKWHPDSVFRWPRAAEMTVACDMSVDMICQVVTDMLNSSSARSSEFL